MPSPSYSCIRPYSDLAELFVQPLSGEEEWGTPWAVLDVHVGSILQQVKNCVLSGIKCRGGI